MLSAGLRLALGDELPGDCFTKGVDGFVGLTGAALSDLLEGDFVFCEPGEPFVRRRFRLGVGVRGDSSVSDSSTFFALRARHEVEVNQLKGVPRLYLPAHTTADPFTPLHAMKRKLAYTENRDLRIVHQDHAWCSSGIGGHAGPHTL